MPDVSNYYPPVGFHFKLNIIGLTGANEGNFSDVSGISYQQSSEDVIERGENRFVHRFPIPAKYDNLILKRGILSGSQLITWATKTLSSFTFEPKTVILNLLSDQNAPVSSWKFINCFPVSLYLSDLKVQQNEIVVETLALSYNYFTKTF